MMPQNQPPLPFPDDWRKRTEELLAAGCRAWQLESRRQDGKDLTPLDIYPAAPKPFRRKLGEQIEAMRSFEEFMDRGVTELHSSDFTVIKDISEGGQGTVVLATDHRVGREVAIKIPHEDITRSGVWERLVEEASMMGNLQHPGVIPVFGLQREDHEGRPFLIMRHVEHEHTLGDEVDNTHRVAGDVHHADKLRSLLRQFVKVCETVQYAHDHNVIHRDLKPDNILVGDYGEVFVVDFGIAQLLQADTGANRLSGTPAYMSPEQAEKDAKIDKRTDVYGLGATLYHLLTGQPPFLAETSAASQIVTASKPRHATIDGDAEGQQEPVNRTSFLQRVRKGDKLKPRELSPSIPKALEAICLKAMSVDPNERYSSANELAAEIDRWLDEKPVDAYPDPWSETVRRWMKRHRTFVTGAGAALIVLVVATAIAAVSIDAARRKERNARQNLAAANAEIEATNAQLKETITELQRPAYVTQFQLAKVLYQENDFAEARRILNTTDQELRGLEWHLLHQACRDPQRIDVGAIAVSDDKHGRRPISRLINSALSDDGSLIGIVASVPSKEQRFAIRLFYSKTGKLVWEREFSASTIITTQFHRNSSRVAVVMYPKGLYGFEPVRGKNEIPKSATILVWDAQTGKTLDSISKDPFEKQYLKSRVVISEWPMPKDQANELIESGSHFAGRMFFPTQSLVDGTLVDDRCMVVFCDRVVSPDSEHNAVAVRVPDFSPPYVGTISPPLSAAINSANTLFATFHRDDTIRIWTTGESRMLAAIPAQRVSDMAFVGDRGKLVWTSKEGVWSWELPMSLTRSQTASTRVKAEDILKAAQSADGRVVAYLLRGGVIAAWDVDTGKLMRRFVIEIPKQQTTPDGDTSGVAQIDLALNEDASLLCVGYPTTKENEMPPPALLIDVSTGRHLHELPGLTGPMAFVAGESALVMYVPEKHRLAIVNAGTGVVRRYLPADVDDVHVREVQAAIRDDDIENELAQDKKDLFQLLSRSYLETPNFLDVHAETGRMVAMPNVLRDPRIQVWNIDSGKRHADLSWDAWSRGFGNVLDVEFSPNGETIAALSNVAQIRDTKTWQVAAVLKGHQYRITDLAYSRDRGRIATASKDGTVRLWDARTGTLLWTLFDPDFLPSPFWFVSFGKDDLELIAGSANGFVTWDVRSFLTDDER